MTEELELKYDVTDPDAVAAWIDEHFPLGDGQAWRTARTTDRYIDTADGALAAAGYGARLRRVVGRTTLGLKSDVDVDRGLHRRREIEAPATGHLRPARWPDSEARAIVTRLAGCSPLVERFVLQQRRRERPLSTAGGTFVVSLDEALVLRDGRPAGTLRGLEIELREGRRRALARLARELEAGASRLLVAQPLSKMRLAEGMVAAAQPIGLDDIFAEAGRRVLARHLARMLEREAVARHGDTTALRQMRVATRRMRAVWRVFDGAFRRGHARRYRSELRALARRLGAVRDLDALLERLPAEPALAPLAEAWHAQRAVAFADLLAHLDSTAYRRFVTDYRTFVATPGAATARRMVGARVGDLAGDRITAAHRRVADFGDLADAELDTLHALRIAARRFRYTLETFREVLPEAPLARLVARLVALQDHLGALNDAHVATVHEQRWLDEQGARADQAARTAVEAYVADRQAEITHLRRGVGRPWRGIAGPSFARDLERLLVPLDPRRGGQATQLAATPDAPFTEP